MPVFFYVFFVILLVFSYPYFHFPTKSLIHVTQETQNHRNYQKKKKGTEIKNSHLFLSQEVLLVNLE